MSLLASLIAQTTYDLDGIEPVTEAYSEGSNTAGGAVNNIDILISNVIGFVTIMAGLFFLTQFLMAAWSWMSSGGDSGKLQKARDQMINSVLGLILVVAAYGIIGFIGTLVGIDILNIDGLIKDLTNNI